MNRRALTAIRRLLCALAATETDPTRLRAIRTCVADIERELTRPAGKDQARRSSRDTITTD